MDRFMVGLTDNTFKHRFLTEDSAKSTLDQAVKIIVTSEIAATHTRALANNEGVGLVGSVNNRYTVTGGAGAELQRYCSYVGGMYTGNATN